jgi:hypothetical protein
MTTEREASGNGKWCAACGQAATREVPPWWLCEPCAAALEKYRSVAIHAEPWGLREARRGGFAKY